ncbi:hypothetical protein ADM96_20140 [Burkholderia sp. ST111]|nr:hypothetical protein ADM96_20140 [Burkholderia sp. ST111]
MSDHREIEQRHHKSMNDVASMMAKIFKGYGFALFIFPFNGENGRMNYISNAAREDMLVALKEFIANNEGRAHEPPEATQ